MLTRGFLSADGETRNAQESTRKEMPQKQGLEGSAPIFLSLVFSQMPRKTTPKDQGFLPPLLNPRKPPLRAQRLKKFKIALRDWNFQSRLKISSEPPPNPYLFVGKPEGQDWKFQSRLKISSEIEIFNRDWIFSIFGPLGPGKQKTGEKQLKTLKRQGIVLVEKTRKKQSTGFSRRKTAH